MLSGEMKVEEGDGVKEHVGLERGHGPAKTDGADSFSDAEVVAGCSLALPAPT